MSEELRLRIISGVIMAVVVLGLTYTGGIAFRLFAGAVGLLIFWEWAAMTRLGAKGNRIGLLLGWAALAMVMLAMVAGLSGTAGLLLVSFVIFAVVFSLSGHETLWLPGGLAYAGLSALSLAAIREGAGEGLAAMIVVFAVVWATDILAYFVGRRLKGPKLAPAISPGKTWSGAIGGTISGILAALIAISAFGGGITAGLIVILLVLSVTSQIGDLFESFIKRRFGVKDSSHLIPGHGGVMDRVDGLVAAAFAAYLLASLAALSGSPASVAALLLSR